MTLIPQNPDALLTRDDTAAALTEAGFITSPKTLASKASRGGGPQYQLFGPRVLYRWRDALGWAQNRCTEPRRSSSKGETASPPQHRHPNRNGAAGRGAP